MITQWFLQFLHGLATTLFGWTSTALPSPPSFWTDATSAVQSVFGAIPGPVRWFVPIGPAVVAGAAFIGLVVALGLIRLARRVLSLFTGGGGMA